MATSGRMDEGKAAHRRYFYMAAERLRKQRWSFLCNPMLCAFGGRGAGSCAGATESQMRRLSPRFPQIKQKGSSAENSFAAWLRGAS